MSSEPSQARTFATVLVVGLSLVVVGLAGAFGWLVVRDHQQTVDLQAFGHQAVQQNVRARWDDCQEAEQLRRALRIQVSEGKRTDPLLYKLVPSLDTPRVHRIVAEQRAHQLHAYRSRDCRAYAMSAVPPAQRGQYVVPDRP